MAINFVNYGIPKLIRLLVAYVSLEIATNYMSQIYTENVLVNNTDPPSLVNLVILFIIIDLIINALLLLLLFLVNNTLQFTDGDPKFFKVYIAEYLIVSIALLIQFYFISSIMYSKKFFLYQDDGLRAIRALKSLFAKFIFLYNVIPFGLLIQDSL